MEGPVHVMAWEALQRRVGTEFGPTEWVSVTQPMIDAFADVTDDHYFLHLDAVRAAATPLGSTIAHGMLTLSLLPALGYRVCPYIEGARYPLNYGYNRVRFVAPVPVDARLRGRFALRSAEAVAPEQRQLTYEATVEIEGADRPALVAEWLIRYVV